MGSGIGTGEGEVKGLDRSRWRTPGREVTPIPFGRDGGDADSTTKVIGGQAGTLMLSLLLFVASCEYPNDAVVVENRSSQTVILVEEFRDNRSEGYELGPAEIYQTRQECVDGDFIVESLEGEELARRRGPFCQGDPPWVIDDALLGAD